MENQSTYVSPKMDVYKINTETAILQTSDGGDVNNPGGNVPGGFFDED